MLNSRPEQVHVLMCHFSIQASVSHIIKRLVSDSATASSLFSVFDCFLYSRVYRKASKGCVCVYYFVPRMFNSFPTC